MRQSAAAALAAEASEVPRLDWSEFWPMFGHPGWYRCNRIDGADHVCIVGPTGGGKSTLLNEIATLRPYVAQFVEKPHDGDEELRKALKRQRYAWRNELPDLGGPRRVVIWPKHRGGDIPVDTQHLLFGNAMRDAYQRGGWHIGVHELQHEIERLNLRRRFLDVLRMGRSRRVGMIAATGRPAWIPRDFYSASAHLFFFNTNDREDLANIGGLNGVDSHVVRYLVANLDRDAHEVLYVNTRTRYIAVTRMDRGL